MRTTQCALCDGNSQSLEYLGRCQARLRPIPWIADRVIGRTGIFGVGVMPEFRVKNLRENAVPLGSGNRVVRRAHSGSIIDDTFGVPGDRVTDK